jgi:hypothetical protein
MIVILREDHAAARLQGAYRKLELGPRIDDEATMVVGGN